MMRHQFGGPEPDNYPMQERIARERLGPSRPNGKLAAELRIIADGFTLGRRSREHDYRAVKAMRQAADALDGASTPGPTGP